LSDEPAGPRRRSEAGLRLLGGALEGLAKRVGEIVSDVSRAVPEPVRAALDEARAARLDARPIDARARLESMLAAHPDEPALHVALAFTEALAFTMGVGDPERARRVLVDGRNDRVQESTTLLLEAAMALSDARSDDVLDRARRASKPLGLLSEALQEEAQWLLHLLRGLAYRQRGRRERALRELAKARELTRMLTSQALECLVVAPGVDVLLAEGRPVEALTWLRALAPHRGGDPQRGGTLVVDPASHEHAPVVLTSAVMAGLLARTLAGRGDAVAARALLERVPIELEGLEIHVRVALVLGADEHAQTVAVRLLVERPNHPVSLRLWALCELAVAERHGNVEQLPPARKHDILRALLGALVGAPAPLRAAHEHELAHVALRLDMFTDEIRDEIRTIIEARLAGQNSAEELVLWRARDRLERGDTHAHEDFLPTTPPRFRARPELGQPLGPDECSPLRDVTLYTAALASQRALATAQLCFQRGLDTAAHEALVEALVEMPSLARAKALLATFARPPAGARLEDLLSSATTVLAGVPAPPLGASYAAIETALRHVVAARERLPRPLTIAVMGEFSAGKSTVVNALLGEAVAPTGALPTTMTINVFRRGSGGARVFHRDGSVTMLSADQVSRFLRELDDETASRIRHVDIERQGGTFGDAQVVDTPGLNALDAFHDQVAREFIEQADAVLWVFSATRTGTASEAGMLASLRAGERQVIGVLNKADTLDANEQVELEAYLHKQLGDVLVDVVSMSAKRALERRAGVAPSPDDSAQVLERALERHFLVRARELKRALGIRQLHSALVLARSTLDDVIVTLERHAEAETDLLRSALQDDASMSRFADRLRDGILGLDDVLSRECLALAIVTLGNEGHVSHPGPVDLAYLDMLVREAALEAMQLAMSHFEISNDDMPAQVIATRFVPWAHGFVEGQLVAGTAERMVASFARAATKNEAELRAAIRSALAPMAAAWHTHASELGQALVHARKLRARRRASRPKSEALRIRVAILPSVDALRTATESLS